jgi:hypothetical protein
VERHCHIANDCPEAHLASSNESLGQKTKYTSKTPSAHSPIVKLSMKSSFSSGLLFQVKERDHDFWLNCPSTSFVGFAVAF